ncbi:FIG00469824: hypothetical protein [hydrothermal vent metagenome]|uniref:Uncharacterized protein n=1 Tax=hydrothermal vent metagenome TaxID=652676 RepID=A0A1W1C5J0_9ZZZZ
MSEKIEDIRLVPAPIELEYSEAATKPEEFEREYHRLSESDDDPIGQWLKLAKARGETSETDTVLLNLIVELHRKVDKLEALLKNEKPKRVVLTHKAHIDSIGYEHFKIKTPNFKEGTLYYGRIAMPVHPKRDVAVYFKALSSQIAKIEKMHERDIKEWNSYVAARERVLIREMKEKRR